MLRSVKVSPRTRWALLRVAETIGVSAFWILAVFVVAGLLVDELTPYWP